jgi:hypothetical protein
MSAGSLDTSARTLLEIHADEKLLYWQPRRF